MDFITVLKNVASPSWIAQYRVVKFTGTQEYPLLFFSLLIQHLKKKGSQPIQTLGEGESYSNLIHRFESSFLGMSSVYWLGDLQRYDQTQRDKLTAYLNNYQGPNVLVVYMPAQTERTERSSKNTLVVEVPTLLTKKHIQELCTLFGNGRVRTAPDLGMYEKQLTLDRVCLLIQYLSVVGSGVHDFNEQWLGYVIVPELSLFTLSQYFFARDGMRFFKQWAVLKDQYAAPFWISFWSEQVWRASLFIELSEQRNFAEAKRISFKLPFSFIQRDWKQVTSSELKRAHDVLYHCDYAIKNGGDQNMLELFYTDYLQRLYQ
jgi:hypothetical protein